MDFFGMIWMYFDGGSSFTTHYSTMKNWDSWGGEEHHDTFTLPTFLSFLSQALGNGTWISEAHPAPELRRMQGEWATVSVTSCYVGMVYLVLSRYVYRKRNIWQMTDLIRSHPSGKVWMWTSRLSEVVGFNRSGPWVSDFKLHHLSSSSWHRFYTLLSSERMIRTWNGLLHLDTKTLWKLWRASCFHCRIINKLHVQTDSRGSPRSSLFWRSSTHGRCGEP